MFWRKSPGSLSWTSNALFSCLISFQCINNVTDDADADNDNNDGDDNDGNDNHDGDDTNDNNSNDNDGNEPESEQKCISSWIDPRPLNVEHRM